MVRDFERSAAHTQQRLTHVPPGFLATGHELRALESLNGRIGAGSVSYIYSMKKRETFNNDLNLFPVFISDYQ